MSVAFPLLTDHLRISRTLVAGSFAPLGEKVRMRGMIFAKPLTPIHSRIFAGTLGAFPPLRVGGVCGADGERAGVRIRPNVISRFEPLNQQVRSNDETQRAFPLLPGGEGRDEGERLTIFGFMGRTDNTPSGRKADVFSNHRQKSVDCPPSPVSSPQGEDITLLVFGFHHAQEPIQSRVCKQTLGAFLPLPKGEGRGEGKEDSGICQNVRTISSN